ncbi:MAG: hypothetical protein QF691_11435, partial [SAR324 cluster bacterium]|nr:hypothetical protein [SAR324 cluster bacterium]
FGSPSLALDMAHWDEKRVRSNSSTIWMLLSGKCSKVSNPAKKPRCDEQIRKWQNHREGNIEGEEKPVQVISQEKGGMFKVVHNQYGTQKIKKYKIGTQKPPNQVRNTGGINKFQGYRNK